MSVLRAHPEETVILLTPSALVSHPPTMPSSVAQLHSLIDLPGHTPENQDPSDPDFISQGF